MSKSATRSAALTNALVAAAFGVSTMTLWHWRKGIPSHTNVMPHKKGDGVRGAVSYDADKLIKWAEKQGIVIPKAGLKILANSKPVASAVEAKPTAAAKAKSAKPADPVPAKRVRAAKAPAEASASA